MTIETKYSVGEPVWIIANNGARCMEVFVVFTSTRNSTTTIEYSFWDESVRFEEKLVFPTKEALIQSL